MKFLLTTIIISTPLLALAQSYVPLVGVPGLDDSSDFGGYVNALYILAISIAAFLAVVKIIFGGVKYMMSDVVTTKGEAKKDIQGALVGLLIVLGAFLILETINPQLNNLDVFRSGDTISGSATGVFDLVFPGDMSLDWNNVGIDQTIDIGNATEEELQQRILACVGPNNETGYVWSQSRDASGRLIGQCTRDDGSREGATGSAITQPEDAVVIRDTCYSLNSPYIESETTVGGVTQTVGYCGTACTPQEQFSTDENRCVPFSETNPNTDTDIISGSCSQPSDLFGNPDCSAVTVQLGGYDLNLVQAGTDTLTVNCTETMTTGSGYGEVCQQFCTSGEGILSGDICTLTRNP